MKDKKGIIPICAKCIYYDYENFKRPACLACSGSAYEIHNTKFCKSVYEQKEGDT